LGPAGWRIGCDLEFLEPRETDFFRDYFTAEELSLMEQNANRPMTAMVIWSGKESLLKILREGLRRDTRSVIVDPDLSAPEGNWNAWTGRCLQISQNFHGWWRACEGYVYTLAADRPIAIPHQIAKPIQL
jgi:4'-phosphopantetheinyl transferase